MDYTTLALVKDEIHGQTTGRDTLISRLVTAVSRRVDRHCSHWPGPESGNYFQLADVANEMLIGVDVFRNERIVAFPHKPYIASVAAMAWRSRPDETWNVVNPNIIEINSPRVYAYIDDCDADAVTVRISYRGGLGLTQADLPADFVQHVTVWAARAFKEAATGLTDAIGLDELGILSYVKAIPSTVADGLQPYERMVHW